MKGKLKLNKTQCCYVLTPAFIPDMFRLSSHFQGGPLQSLVSLGVTINCRGLAIAGYTKI